MEKDRPIGVIDSGVGGLTVLKWLQKKMPHEQFIFIGDTARTPYGDRPREEIQRFVKEMTDHLARRKIKELVIACNTITVLGLDAIRNGYDFDVIGMAKGASNIREVTHNNKVGFLRRTLRFPQGPISGKSSALILVSRCLDLAVRNLCPSLKVKNLAVRKCRKLSRNMQRP